MNAEEALREIETAVQEFDSGMACKQDTIDRIKEVLAKRSSEIETPPIYYGDEEKGTGKA